MNIKWNELLTIEDWSNLLEKILKEAEEAIKQNDFAQKEEIQEILRRYIKESPPGRPIDTLDEIAMKAYKDLFISIVDKCIAAIASRNAELKKARELIAGVTEQAKKSTKAIMFENVVNALDKSKRTLDAFKGFVEALDSPDQNLLDKIEAVNVSLTQLNAKINEQS